MRTMQRILLQVPALVMLLFLVVPGPAQPPEASRAIEEITSRWWSPLGNLGATRHNPVPTASQTAADVKIKWRTNELKNSPVLLVGAIRTPANEYYQQIVGLEEGSKEIIILRPNGFVDTVFTNRQTNVQSLKLTGLFDTLAPTINPTERPNVIGVGVEQVVIDNTTQPIGLFVDRNGSQIYRLGLGAGEVTRIASYEAPNNNVTILPIAVYRRPQDTLPVSVSIVTQDRFTRHSSNPPRVDTMINSVRKHNLTRGSQLVDTLGQPYFLAMKLYETQPAFLYDNVKKDILLSLSTRQYSTITPSIFVRGNTGGSTSSDTAAPISFNVKGTIPERVAYEPAFAGSSIATYSAFPNFILTRVDSTGDILIDTNARIISQRKTPSDISTRRLELKNTTTTLLSGFEPPGPHDSQEGWNLVTADVDGEAPGFPDINTYEDLVNNPGSELIITASPNGSSEGGKNWLYVLRWNEAQTLGGGRSFYYFTRQLIDGQVIAAGDIIKDANNRQELLLAKGDTLFVLQMKSYSFKDDFQNINERDNVPFLYLKTFALDDSIVSVAIADIEGDGENDIIVSTKSSTYAIGKVQPNPYPFVTDPNPFNQEYCVQDSLTVVWNRNVGEDDTELEAYITGVSGKVEIKGALTGDQVRFAPKDLDTPLTAGNYQIIVRNKEFPYIADTSESFTIAQGVLGSLGFKNDLPFTSGSLLEDTVSTYCLDTVRLQQRIGDGNWIDVQDAVEKLSESQIRIAVPLPCPETTGCGTGTKQQMSFRVISEADTSDLRSLELRVTSATLSINPGLESLSRTRTLSWNAESFPCPELLFLISDDGGENWSSLGSSNTIAESLEIQVPEDFSDTVVVCAQCTDAKECIYGLVRFQVNKVIRTNYVYPNPFNPAATGPSSQDANIVYFLDTPGSVSITIYDASRTVVRKLVTSEKRRAGINRGDKWDGKKFSWRNCCEWNVYLRYFIRCR